MAALTARRTSSPVTGWATAGGRRRLSAAQLAAIASRAGRVRVEMVTAERFTVRTSKQDPPFHYTGRRREKMGRRAGRGVSPPVGPR